MIRVLFFARLREQLGRAELELPWSPDVADAAGLKRRLQSLERGWEAILAEDNILCAVNQEQATPDQAVADGDEVAFFPPVTGG